jgi:uncharacterized protein (DUF2342 family)
MDHSMMDHAAMGHDMAGMTEMAAATAAGSVDYSLAAEIAAVEAPFFPNISVDVLTQTIVAYQQLGCWSENPAISEASYQKLLDVFLYNGMITQRHPYQAAIVPPPDE